MKRFPMTAIAVLLTAIVYAVLADSNFGVGPQYDTTHVYVRPEDFSTASLPVSWPHSEEPPRSRASLRSRPRPARPCPNLC